MCGRFTLRTSVEKLAAVFHFADQMTLPLWYDIRPTQSIAAVRAKEHEPERELATFRWGLIPPWANDIKAGPTPFNARGETAASNKLFAPSLKSRRCAIPADAFYEWMAVAPKRKQKHLIRLTSGEPFAFAGLWNRWTRGPEPIESATLITTEPNALAAMVHNRMPVILTGDAIDRWLDPEIEDGRLLLPLLTSYDADAMEAFPVRNESEESPDCVEPVGRPLSVV